jgi:nucleoid DNA-binding protein
MTSDAFVQLLSAKSGFSKWDLYEILSDFGDLIKEQVYENGDTVSIGGLGEFRQIDVASKSDSPFKILGFKPIPSMNNDSL